MPSISLRAGGALLAFALLPAACASASPPPSGSIVPGTAAHPREIVVIARDYLFEPSPIVLVPGETVLIHVFDAGLLTHELVIGDAAVQTAWETAEANPQPAAPGQTPPIASPAGALAGLRVVVQSGERRDVAWTVPPSPAALIAGCHIRGHYARGMRTAVELRAPKADGGPPLLRRSARTLPEWYAPFAENRRVSVECPAGRLTQVLHTSDSGELS